MNTTTSARTLRTMLATAAVISATALAGLAMPAHASDHSPGSYLIDQDYVRVDSADGTSKVVADKILAFFRRNRMEVQVHGTVHRDAAAAGCRSAKVTFVFADESTETTSESPRACKAYGVTDKFIDFHPTKDKDVVRYHVSLLTSTDLTAPAMTLKTTTGLVGDAPDSFGTAARLDHDAMQLFDHEQKIFADGAVDWRIQREDISGVTLRFARGRVQGMLTRPTALEGTKAWLQATWFYADGSSAKKLSGAVTAATPTLRVDMSSDRYKEAVAVEIKVITDWPTSSAPLLKKFGNWYSK